MISGGPVGLAPISLQSYHLSPLACDATALFFLPLLNPYLLHGNCTCSLCPESSSLVSSPDGLFIILQVSAQMSASQKRSAQPSTPK